MGGGGYGQLNQVNQMAGTYNNPNMYGTFNQETKNGVQQYYGKYENSNMYGKRNVEILKGIIFFVINIK